MRPLILLAVAGLVGCSGRPVPPEVPPDPTTLPMSYRDHNVVLVSFDALQAAHVGHLGNPRDVTPTLDAASRDGFTFSKATSVSSWTVPASMTWFTGVYPSEHRMTNKFAIWKPPVQKLANLRELSPDLLTLAEILKADGYATGGFTGNAGVSGGFGYEQGFDEYYYPAGVFGGLDESIPRALEWVKARRGQKFFLFLHGYDVHGQSVPHGGLDYRFVPRGYDRRYRGTEPEQEALREEGLQKGQLTLRPEDVAFWRAVYDEKIQRADVHFKEFLAAFDALGLRGKTLFVLTSDHGTEFYEHRRFDHGFSLYQELLHVPLVIQLPGQRGGKVVGDYVGSVDVMPTVLDLLSVPVSDKAKGQMRGASLVSAMQGTPPGRDVFSETDYRQYTYKRSVVTPDGWKLIYTLESKTRELYNLRSDPKETHDLAGVEKARADELERKVFDHFKAIGHDLTARKWEVGLNPVYPSQGKP